MAAQISTASWPVVIDVGHASPPPLDPPRRAVRFLHLGFFAGILAGLFLGAL